MASKRTVSFEIPRDFSLPYLEKTAADTPFFRKISCLGKKFRDIIKNRICSHEKGKMRFAGGLKNLPQTEKTFLNVCLGGPLRVIGYHQYLSFFSLSFTHFFPCLNARNPQRGKISNAPGLSRGKKIYLCWTGSKNAFYLSQINLFTWCFCREGRKGFSMAKCA